MVKEQSMLASVMQNSYCYKFNPTSRVSVVSSFAICAIRLRLTMKGRYDVFAFSS